MTSSQNNMDNASKKIGKTKDELEVVITRKLPDIIETRLMELYKAKLNRTDEAFSHEQLCKSVATADILVPTVTDAITKEVLSHAGPNLKLIASYGAGVDHIDLIAANEKGIKVSNTPEVLTEDTADMTMALILAVSRRLAEGERLARSGQWEGWSPTHMLGHRIWGKRLGIVGMGRIGTALARRAKGFGMAIHYHNRMQVQSAIEDELEATYWNNLGQMLSHTDIVSINCPGTPATFHLINKKRIEFLKPHAIIVNTSRGQVIQEDALIKALQQGEIAGAGLDVYEHSSKIDDRLLKMDQVVLLPHMGSATIDGRIEMGERVLFNIQNHLDGHLPPDMVIETTF